MNWYRLKRALLMAFSIVSYMSLILYSIFLTVTYSWGILVLGVTVLIGLTVYTYHMID